MKNFQDKATKFSHVNAYWLAWCSQLAYSTPLEVSAALEKENMRMNVFIDQGNTQAFICSDDDKMIVSVRGTDGLADAMTDLNIDLVDGTGGRVHEGFQMSALSIWPEVYRHIQNRGKRSLWLAGHSLGASIATILTAKLVQQKDEPVNGLYTIGSPRTGDKKFARHFDQSFGARTFRFVNNNDIVTRTPFRSMGFSHVGQIKYFDEHGQFRPDLHWWEKLLDRINGRWLDLFERGTDGIKDHNADHYVNLIGGMVG